MKILLLQLIGVGGTQLYSSQLANALSKNDEIVMLLGKHLYDEKHYENSNAKIILFGTESSYIKMFFKLINPITYYSLLRIIQKENPDVIHLVFEDLISAITFFMLHMTGKKMIFTEHDPSLHLGEGFLARLNQKSAKLLARFVADSIIVHGDKQKMTLVEKGVSPQKIHILPIGDFSYYTKWMKKINEEKNAILFFGRILEYKGLKYLIESIPKIANSVPNVKVIIAGDGDIAKYADTLEDKKRFEVHNRFIPEEEVAYFFQRASIVALPYIDASQSGVVPVAYAFKKPVVVTNVGSLSEIVEDNVTGFVVPPRNVHEFSEAIIRLLKDDVLRTKFGLAGYNKMQSELSWEKIADRTTEIYRSK